MHEQFNRAQQWLEHLLMHSGFPSTVTVDTARLDSEGSCWLVIDESTFSSAQLDLMVGEKGLALDAIQYLANTILNLGQPHAEQHAYTVEIGHYRADRQAELHALAQRIAEQVRETQVPQEMEGLSSAERRQVHTFLQTFDDLETESIGREPDRRLVVRCRSGEVPE